MKPAKQKKMEVTIKTDAESLKLWKREAKRQRRPLKEWILFELNQASVPF